VSSKLVDAETDCTFAGAFLRDAVRRYADLSGADLRGATSITNEYEDWIKTKVRGEDGKNGDLS